MVSSIGYATSRSACGVCSSWACDRRRSRRKAEANSVGRGRHDAGVDAVLAAAVPPVQRTAGGEALRPAARRTDAPPPRAVDSRAGVGLPDNPARALRRLQRMTDMACRRQPARRAGPAGRTILQLMKPRVMSLVVFTALTGLVCPEPPSIRSWRRRHPLHRRGRRRLGALNMWYDADIDAKMRRTAGRPVPAGRVQRAAPWRWAWCCRCSR